MAIAPKIVTGTIKDVKHIVVLMQENRSFDHYLGSLRGVRGFSDPRAVTLPSGNPVFQQPNGAGTILPFRPQQPFLGSQFVGDLAHNWSDQHNAWNNGNNDGWVAAKGSIETMTFLNRGDIPFQYALADAFTVCDNYHCSIMGPTDPNRYYMWTGWDGQNGTQTDTLAQPFSASAPGTFDLVAGPSTGNGVLPGGPVVNNDEQGYDWLTYPERLEAAGISWKIYQDIGLGLTPAQFEGFTDNPFIGNFGDNSLLYFLQYQNAQPGSALFDKARIGTNLFNGGAFNGGSLFQQLQSDVKNNTLPQVSWVVAPQAYWCIIHTLEASGFVVHPYQATVPAFGIWGFALATVGPSSTPTSIPADLASRLRFLDPPALAGLFQFPADLRRVESEINRLDNQVLVRYYDAEWRKWD